MGALWQAMCRVCATCEIQPADAPRAAHAWRFEILGNNSHLSESDRREWFLRFESVALQHAALHMCGVWIDTTERGKNNEFYACLGVFFSGSPRGILGGSWGIHAFGGGSCAWAHCWRPIKTVVWPMWARLGARLCACNIIIICRPRIPRPFRPSEF